MREEAKQKPRTGEVHRCAALLCPQCLKPDSASTNSHPLGVPSPVAGSIRVQSEAWNRDQT